MDDVVTRFAHELADAIATAVAESPQVEACRERARAAGYEMRVTLEATVGFVRRAQADQPASAKLPRETPVRPPVDMTTNDRRFLRSLRIAADEAAEEVN